MEETMKHFISRRGRTVPQTERSNVNETRLIQATRCGDLVELKQLLSQGVNLTDPCRELWKDWGGVTILHMAARYNQHRAMEMLIAYGAEVNAEAPLYGTPLQVACRFGNSSTIRLLLKHGAMLHLDTDQRGRILQALSQYSNVDIVELVYKDHWPPPVNFTDCLGATPLHYAAFSGNDQMCTWLIERGADVNVKDSRKVTAFMLACQKGHVITMTIIFAAETGGLVTPSQLIRDVDDEDKTSLHHTIIENKSEAAHLLLRWGANTNCADNESITPLHIAAVQGNVAMVVLLVTFGAKTEKRDKHGKTPLLLAAHHKKTEIITTLAEHGADINAEDKDWQSSLAHACIHGDTEVVKTLLDLRVSLVKRSWHQYSCLQLAIKHGHLDILTLLLEDPACDADLLNALDIETRSVLHLAAMQKDMRFLDLLLTKGCSVEERNGCGELPLHLAAMSGSYSTVYKLAQLTCDVNCECYVDKSPFFCACEYGNREATQALLKLGANFKETDGLNRNTLIVAAMGGFTDIVEDLIELGMSLSSSDRQKNTALHHACSRGNLSTVEALLKHQASVTAVNVHGQSPLDMAIENGHSEVTTFLMTHESWEESLSVRNASGLSSIDKMIEHTPEAVRVVLDKCVKTSSDSPAQEEFTIEFNYKYIDPGPKDISNKNGVYNALVAMLKWGREDLLGHPVCQSHLSYKWRGFGRVVQFMALFTQGGFLFSLFLYYFLMKKPHEQGYDCYMSRLDAPNTTNSTVYFSQFFDPSNRPPFTDYYMHIVQRILHFFMITAFLWEIGTIIALGKRHLFSIQFLMTLVTLLLIGYATLPAGYAPCDHEWRAIAYGTMISFVIGSLFIVRFDQVGFYFVMYFEVIKTMLKVSTMLFFFVIGMSIPLDIMMHQDGFQSGQPSIITTLAMTLGEMQFRDNFIKANDYPFNYELYGLFVVCCIFLNLALMNLMIGAAVGDISKVEKRAYMTRLRTQVTFLLESEAAVPRVFRDWFHTEKLVIRPNKQAKTFWQAVYKRFIYPEQIEFIKKTEELTQASERAKVIEKQIETQRKKLDELVQTTSSIVQTLQRLEGAMTPQPPGSRP